MFPHRKPTSIQSVRSLRQRQDGIAYVKRHLFRIESMMKSISSVINYNWLLMINYWWSQLIMIGWDQNRPIVSQKLASRLATVASAAWRPKQPTQYVPFGNQRRFTGSFECTSMIFQVYETSIFHVISHPSQPCLRVPSRNLMKIWGKLHKSTEDASGQQIGQWLELVDTRRSWNSSDQIMW